MLPTWLLSIESQSVILTGIILLFSWITINWIIQAIVALLWPLIAMLLIFVLFLPHTADRIFKDLLTADKIQQWINCFIRYINDVISAMQGRRF